jgi:hypothetical protein
VSTPDFGLFLNCGGEVEGRMHAETFEIALAQAELAERLGYRDVWWASATTRQPRASACAPTCSARSRRATIHTCPRS